MLSVAGHAQSQQELIQQAKAMGVSDAQIAEVMSSQQQQQSSSSIANTALIVEEPRQVEEETELTPKSENKRGATVFGREIFTNKDLSFSPNYNIPTPKDYILGAGDEVKINIWGNSELNLSQKISPEGQIFIENIGPITLSGLTVDGAEAKVKQELSRIFKGLNDGTNSLALALGQIRSIQVNIVGEAFAPGTYMLPSFSTLFNALYMAGGVNDIGSLRSVKVYNNNKLKAEVDVYDYLLNGKTDVNVRLEDGDMVMVSPYEALVETTGELKRNRIYELKEGETLAQLLEMAGSFKGGAYTKSVNVERKDGDYLSVKSVKADDFGSFAMMDGDNVSVRELADRYKNRVVISGAVWYPGNYELSEQVGTVKQLVEEASGLKGDEFAGRAQITRTNPDFTKSLIAVDIKGIVNGTAADVALQRDDSLHVPSLFDMREEYLIKISGAVNMAQDSLAYMNNMTVEDAIVAAGGLKESASEIKVDIARRVKDPKSSSTPNRIVEVMEVALNEGLKIAETGEPLLLEPFDEVLVRYSPGYREQETVAVDGEVLFKGEYVLRDVDSRLSDVLADAGGVTDYAYIKGATLTRRLSEAEKIRVASILEISKGSFSKDSIALDKIDIDRYSVGIDLKAALENPGSLDDIVLRSGDRLYIPKMQSTVKISGAVVYPNSTTYYKKMKVKDCLDQAGGYGANAKRRPIVIYMNGKAAPTKGFWFFKNYPKIEPGCEVLVMDKREREKMSMTEVMSIASSTTSMAAMVTSLISTLGN